MTNIRIRKTDWTHDAPGLAAIRRTVFIEEQHVPEDMEWDGQDAASTHFIADDPLADPAAKDPIHGSTVGCVRLLPTGQISRLSVLENRRTEGVGRALLDAAINEARTRNLREVFLHAQTHATSFYEAAGFSVDGGIFMEAGIPHRLMVKTLT